MDIDKSINILYNKSGLMQRYGDQVWISILLIFAFGVIFTYISVLNHMQKVKKNWASERCNPFIMPIAGWINNTDKANESDAQYTINNFEFCLGNIITNFFHYMSDGLKNVVSGLEDIFKDIGIILSGIINFLMSIISGILNLIENLWNLILQGYVASEQGLNSVRDSVSRLMGTLIVVMYTQILSFRLSIMWMITTPIFMLFTTILSVLIELLLWCVSHQLYVMWQWTTFAFCITGISIASLGTGIAVFLSWLAANGTLLAGSLNAMGASLMGMIPAELFIPFVGEGMAAGSLSGAISAFISGIAAILAAIISGIGALASAIAAGIGIAQTVASCVISITSVIYGIIKTIFLITSVAGLMVMLYILYLCWAFVKQTLGQMNVPGQGIPGLSF